MTKKTGDDFTPTHDEDKDTQIFENDADTKILTPDLKKTEEIPPGFQPNIVSEGIGSYRIIRKLGEGGMGMVYEAEQQNPQRRVALKVIRRGFHTNEYHIKLFEREIQALARLKHPGIAQIYESGHSEDGQIFFAMELVRGTSLLNYVHNRNLTADGSRFDVRRKLELFNKIGEVVSYAHQRGVIHRDLKPDNILVTDNAETPSLSDSMMGKVGVKILDFGLARINDPDIAGTNQLSQVGQIKGTLQYMSPEQVRGKSEEIDVRSDVYSLGVMLYEMLTGQLPYDLSQASIPQAAKIICDEPPKTLNKIISETSGEDRKKIAKIDEDVETIVLKALEKESDRRYQSVAAMVEDIERYLTNQPILARPPSTFYQFRKLVARHKAAFASLAAIFLIVLGFGIVMAAQSVRLASERDRAVKAENEAENARQNEQKQRQIAENNFKRAEEEKNSAEQAKESEQKQRQIAEESLKRAEEQQAIAEKEKSLAEKSQKSEQEQRQIAEENLKQAQTEQKRAEEQTSIAKKQEAIANEQKTLAEKRQNEIEEQKTIVENEAEKTRRLFYVSQMNLAGEAWEQADIPRLEELLRAQIPQPGQEDLRGFEWYYLWKLAHSDIQSFRQELVSPFPLFSPDLKLLVVNKNVREKSISKNKITIFDGFTGKEFDSIVGKLFLAFLPDGNLLTIPFPNPNSGGESTLEILDLKTKQVNPTKSKYSTYKGGAEFSPNGKLMCQYYSDRIEIIDVESGEMLLSPPGSNNPDFSRFSADSKILAFLSRKDGEDFVNVWDIETKKEISVFHFGEEYVVDFAFLPNGKILGTIDSSNKLRLWEIATKKVVDSFELEPHKSSEQLIHRLIKFSHDGKIIALANGRYINLIMTNHSREDVIKGFGEEIRSITFSPDSKKLAVISDNGTMKIWDISDFVNSIYIGQFRATFSTDGNILATTDKEDSLKLWNFASNREIASFGMGKVDSFTSLGAHSLKLSPDAKTVAVKRMFYKDFKSNESLKNQVELWDTVSKGKLATFENIENFSFSPDGKLLAVVLAGDRKQNLIGGEVQLWDIATLKKVGSLEKGLSVTFSPDGKTLAIGKLEEIKLINISTGKEIMAISGTGTGGWSNETIKFSPNSKILAFAKSKNITLWDLETQKEIVRLKGHTSEITSLTFSPDGRRLVTGEFIFADDKIRIWDLETKQQITLFNTEGGANSLTFSPDGKTLIVDGYRDGFQIWRAATEEEVLQQIKP